MMDVGLDVFYRICHLWSSTVICKKMPVYGRHPVISARDRASSSFLLFFLDFMFYNFHMLDKDDTAFHCSAKTGTAYDQRLRTIAYRLPANQNMAITVHHRGRGVTLSQTSHGYLFFFSSADFLLITFVPANWAHRNASRSGLAGGTVFTSIRRQFTIIFLLSAYEYHMLFTPWVSFNV